MKVEKWYKKAAAIFDAEAEKGVISANCEDGFLFANATGTYALFIPGYSACSAVWESGDVRKSKTLRLLYKYANDGILATKQRTGTFPDRRCKVREFANDSTEVYVYEKLLRIFPKNALYYISSPESPVLVGIWENARLCVIGMVMPMMSNEHFRED